MEGKKVKRALSIVFAALFTAILVVFPSFSAIIQSHCKCHTYSNVYHRHFPVTENITTTSRPPANITVLLSTAISNINITELLM